MLRIFLALLLTAFPASAMAYSRATEYLIEEQIKAGCGDREGAFISIDERDLTGDGKPDLIIDHGDLRCLRENPRSDSCGVAACDILIYVRRGALLKLEANFMSVGYEVENDRSPPMIKTIGFEFQEATLRWNGREFGLGGAFPEPKPGVWHYGGSYPIGLSAHIAVEGGAIGFACNMSGSHTVAMRLSPGLIPGTDADGGLNLIFEDSGDTSIYGTLPLKFDSYLEAMLDPSCNEFDRWRDNEALLIVRGTGQTEATAFSGYVTTITQGDRSIPLRTMQDIAKLRNVRRIPLEGAGKAIDDLIRFCPAIKRAERRSCRNDQN